MSGLANHRSELAETRAVEAIAFLEANAEANWRRHIDVDVLQIGDPHRCMMAQLGRRRGLGYHQMKSHLGLTDGQAIDFAFAPGRGVSSAEATAAWVRALS
jgi:hypothetical protein